MLAFAVLAVACRPTGAPRCAEEDCAACLEASARPDTARLVREAEALDTLSVALAAEHRERCVGMANQLVLEPLPPPEEACATVADEIAGRVRDLFPLEVRLAVAAEAAYCRVEPARARACAEACGEPDAPLACTGRSLGACEGRCLGTCHAPPGPCVGRCSDFCDGACDGLCIGECVGECPIRDRDDRCVASCAGTCSLGACVGGCEGECTGICTVDSTEDCGGLCVGECLGAWEAACDAAVEVGALPCGLACTADAARAAECPEPEVRVRGPEVEEVRHHALVDQVVLAGARYLGALYALRARLRLLREPWAGALVEVVTIAGRVQGGGCVEERAARVEMALARLDTIAIEVDAIIAAAEDSVGTLVD